MAKQRHSWPLEKAIETARHFSSRSELFRHFPGCYMALSKAGRLDDLLPKISRKRWTYGKIKALCEQCNIRGKQALAMECPTACRAAYRNKLPDGTRWIDALFHGQ